MTQEQSARLQRAAQIAERDGLAVCGTGLTKDGHTVYAVPSRSEPNRWHVVIVRDLILECDCAAAKYGRMCAHRAAVRARIIEERKANAAKREAQAEAALHQAARTLDAAISATAPLYRSNAPISIWK